jgi:hypothetical protein
MATLLKGAKKTKAPKAPKAAVEHLTPKDDKSDSAVADRLGVTITAPNFKTVEIPIRGTAPYVQLAFGAKARNIMREKQAAGSTASKGKKRAAKDFDANFEEAQHRSKQGWRGIPAGALRNALVDSCVVVGFHKTKAKKAVFVEADGFDSVEGTPLIRLHARDSRGKLVNAVPRHVEHTVRNATGVADIRVRAMYDTWEAKVRIRFDADMFTPADIANLMLRAGMQVGIGEGRADSPNSCGMGWGHFECVRG